VSAGPDPSPPGPAISTPLPHAGPFYFVTERRLVRLTGRRARTLGELAAHLCDVSGASVFYHTHHLYLSHHFRRPVFYNDFANWTQEALQAAVLPEELAAIDLLAFTAIRPLREALLAVMTRHLTDAALSSRHCPDGDEFHFCESQSFVMPTGIVADDPPDFFRKLHEVTSQSLFFHFFGARLRLGRPTNDFSAWLEARGKPRLAAAIDRLDPYAVTLDELKQQIIQIGVPRHGR
jgi:Family of unknown function (DUF5752)